MSTNGLAERVARGAGFGAPHGRHRIFFVADALAPVAGAFIRAYMESRA